MAQNTATKKKYFAAANGFDGFVSYFDRIFDPHLFDRLFILKGGPGTGKNSFMKKVASNFCDNSYDIEEFYCSSDPASLDGIIIKSGDSSVAIIDGTSPHECDTKLPGAVDFIINLGDGWDTRWLEGNRDKIIALNDEKKSAYKNAYQYLKMGKAAFEYKNTIVKNLFDHKAAKEHGMNILNNLSSTDHPTEKIRLISSFGKEGEKTLDTIESISDETVKIGGEKISAHLFIDVLVKSARERGASIQYSPSPLSTNLYDSLYLEDNKIGIYISAESSDINADEFLLQNRAKDLATLNKASEIVKLSKDEAVRWFKIASDFHFRLEEIYSQAMNFSNNEKLISETTREIKIIFDKNK